MAAPEDEQGMTKDEREAARRVILGLRDAVASLQRVIEQRRRELEGGG